MNQPLVSVLMTAYNREQYIGTSIESVLASTFKDFELIVTDDGSDDNTVEIAKSYEQRDKRIKIFVNQKNLGDYPNRNKAAEYASGKYLKYVDADDYIYPWGLEILVSIMERFPNAGWGLCSLEQNAKKPFPFQLSPYEAYTYHYMGPGLFHKAPLSSIIKREVFTEAGGFAAIRMSGDFEMWHRLARRYPVVLMPHGIVWYREHAQQEMSHYRKYIKLYEEIKIKYLYNGCPLPAEMVKTIIKNTKRDLVKQIIKGALSFNYRRIGDNYTRLMQY
jgi:glycosyltransferase involved in cell wall biosynthesis